MTSTVHSMGVPPSGFSWRAAPGGLGLPPLPRLTGGWLIGLIGLWTVCAVAPHAVPTRFASSWTFILPAANNGSTVTLETIGQTSTNSSQPFGSISISPKVIYREVLRSEQVRRAAAGALAVPVERLPRPRVRLIDETSILICDVEGRTPQEAQRRAEAYLGAFNAQLETLRRDEIERRALSVRSSLESYQQKLDTARQRILAAQRETGVLSINQFNEAQTSIELIRRRLAELNSDLGKLDAEQRQIGERLGIGAQAAALSLKLVADPAFGKLAAEFGDAHAAYVQAGARLGPRNPVLMAVETKRSSSLAQLQRLAAERGGRDDVPVDRLALVLNNSHQAELLRTMVSHDAQIEGRRKEIVQLEQQLAARREEMRTMSASSARLEDLKKDQLVAEAVFTSAVARLDTNRTDVFASYPMVQVLAEPDLPGRPAHPIAAYAMLAGLFGSLMILLAWGLTWLRPILARSVPTSG